MKILVTGSSGHLGEALMRTLPGLGHEPIGLDIVPSPFTTIVGSIVDRATVDAAMRGVQGVLHAATLHKPHVATHARQAFVDVNVTGTLNLLEAAVANKVGSFIFTSTTSAFGDALTPPRGAPAAWITEDVVPIPKNIYGATKTAARRTAGMIWISARAERLSFPSSVSFAAPAKTAFSTCCIGGEWGKPSLQTSRICRQTTSS